MRPEERIAVITLPVFLQEGRMRLSGIILGLVLVLGMAAPPAAARPRPDPWAPVRNRVGTIKARLTTAQARASRQLQFLIDGAPRRPQIKRTNVTLKGIPAGNHVLTVLDRSSHAGAHVQVSVRARTATQIGLLHLTPGGQIAGIVSRVRGPDGGSLEPLAGVEVVAEPESFPKPKPLGGKKTPGRLIALTDGSGAYSFRAVPPGSYRVSVVVPGLEAAVQFAWVDLGTTVAVDFRLREAIEKGVGRVAGTLTNAEHQPIVGALVRIYPQEWYIPPTVDTESRTRAARIGRQRQVEPSTLPRDVFATLTDGQGQFALNVPSGHLWAEIWCDGFVPVFQELTVHPNHTTDLSATLERDIVISLGGLEGVVTDAATGHPLEGARVTVLVPIAWFRESPIEQFSAVTDSKGRYRIESVIPGEWEVVAELEGYSNQSKKAAFGEMTVQLDFELAAEM